MSQLLPAIPVNLMESKNRALLKKELPRKTITVPGTPRTCDLLVRSPVEPSSANLHLATSTANAHCRHFLGGAIYYGIEDVAAADK